MSFLARDGTACELVRRPGRPRRGSFALVGLAALAAWGCGSGAPKDGGTGAARGDAAAGTGGVGAGGTSAADGPAGTGGFGGSLGSGSGGQGAGGTSAPGSGGMPDGGPDVGAPEIPPAACAACTSWGAPALLGKVTTPGLDALSGMAASWRNPGIVYVHNDRNRPEVFAIGEDAALVARLSLGGAVAHDIEDMEVGRCPAGTCLYVADIGNNVNPRTEFTIFRAPEPALVPGAPTAAQTLTAERFAFRYADQPHNAESLLIDHAPGPNAGAIYVITKVAAGLPSAVYRLTSFEAGRVNVAMKVADLPVPGAGDQPATAASAHPCGAGFVLRTNNTLYEFRVPVGSPLEAAFAVAPIKIPAGTEVQGEAVSFRADGRAYFTTSEGAAPPLHRVVCQ